MCSCTFGIIVNVCLCVCTFVFESLYVCIRVMVLYWGLYDELETKVLSHVTTKPEFLQSEICLMRNVFFRSQRGIKGGNIFGRNSHDRNIRGANFGVSFRVDLIPRVLPFVVFWCPDVLTSRRSELLGHLHHEWVSRVLCSVLSHTGVLWQMLVCRVRIKSLSAVAYQFLAEAFQEQLHQDLGEFLSFTHTLHAHRKQCVVNKNHWNLPSV